MDSSSSKSKPDPPNNAASDLLNNEGIRSIMGLVSAIVQNPAFQQLRPPATAVAPSPSAANHAGATSELNEPPDESASSSSSSRRFDSETEELRHSFTSKRRRGPLHHQSSLDQSSRRRKVVKKGLKKERILIKNVYLLNRGMNSIPTDRSELYTNGRVINCFRFSINSSAEEMERSIGALFASKIGHLPKPGFRVVKADRNKVFTPTLPSDGRLDGETIAILVGAGHLYIMATGVVGDEFDSHLYQDEDALTSEHEESSNTSSQHLQNPSTSANDESASSDRLQRCKQGLHSIAESDMDCARCTTQEQYDESLKVDRDKVEQQRQADKKKSYEEYLERMRNLSKTYISKEGDYDCSDAINLSFKTSDGHYKRKFNPNGNFQSLVIYVRTFDGSSMDFKLVNRATRLSISSVNTSSIAAYFPNSSVIDVEWENNEIIPEAAENLVAESYLQHDAQAGTSDQDPALQPLPDERNQQDAQAGTSDQDPALQPLPDERNQMNLDDDLPTMTRHPRGDMIAYRHLQIILQDETTSSACDGNGRSVKEVLRLLKRSHFTYEPTTAINVVRHNPLDGLWNAMDRPDFKPEQKLDVVFYDLSTTDQKSEGAVDEGGPTREFLRLCMVEMVKLSIFTESDEGALMLRRSITGFEDNSYRQCGTFIAMSLIHGGPSPQLFAESTAAHILGKSVKPKVGDISDDTIRDHVRKLENAETLEEAQELYTDDTTLTLLNVIGMRKPLMSMDDRDQIVKTLLDYLVIDSMKDVVKEFQEGLSVMGVLEALRLPEMRSLLLYKNKPSISAKEMKSLFETKHTTSEGSNRFKEEAQRRVWFDELLDVVEKGATETKFGDILRFVTGLESEPAIGFSPKPSVTFQHREDFPQLDPSAKMLAKGNTCANQLILPCDVKQHRRFVKFKNDLQLAFHGADCFTSESMDIDLD